MKQINFNKTLMIQNFTKEMERRKYEINEKPKLSLYEEITNILFITMIQFFNNRKGNNKPIIFKFNDENEQFLLYVEQYFNKINNKFNLIFKINEEDNITDLYEIINYSDNLFITEMNSNSKELLQFMFSNDTSIKNLTIDMIRVLYNWISKNILFEEPITLILTEFLNIEVENNLDNTINIGFNLNNDINIDDLINQGKLTSKYRVLIEAWRAIFNNKNI